MSDLYDSEKAHVDKLEPNAIYDATCIHCGETNHIHLWPHRNGHGQMIGMIFACRNCSEIVKGIEFTIHGIRGHDEKLEA
jgi:hypothetical protein